MLTRATTAAKSWQRLGAAASYRGSDPGAFTNWHTIAGAIVGFGQGEGANVLQQWWLSNPVLPSLARALARELSEQPFPHGLKILFGGNRVAEVRVDGEHHEAASRALEAVPWPTLHPAAFVRSYVILLHPENEGLSQGGRHIDDATRMAHSHAPVWGR